MPIRARALRSALFVGLVLLGGAAGAVAQPMGTYRWQQLPYCNVLALSVVRSGDVFLLDGFDDQCGADTRAAASGVAFINPNGTVGIGLTIVATPGGAALHVDATISLASFSGSWRDGAGGTGPWLFTVAPGAGAPRPAARAVFAAGLSANGSTIERVALPVNADDAATKAYVDVGVDATRAHVDDAVTVAKAQASSGDAAVRSYADAGALAARIYADAGDVVTRTHADTGDTAVRAYADAAAATVRAEARTLATAPLQLTAYSAVGDPTQLTYTTLGCVVLNGAAAAAAHLDLPLPAGARITSLRVKYFDNSPSDLRFHLRSISFNVNGGSLDDVAGQGASFGASTSVRLEGIVLNLPAPVTTTHGYYLSISAPQHTGPLNFCGAIVTYTMP